MITIKELASLTNNSIKETKKIVKELQNKNLVIVIDDCIFTVEEFIKNVNKYNKENPDNQIE